MRLTEADKCYFPDVRAALRHFNWARIATQSVAPGRRPVSGWKGGIAFGTTVERKEYPISMRLPEADVAMIDRAASLRGRSRTDFVRDAAVRAAEEVVMEQGLIRMSPEGFANFMAILSSPPTIVSEMMEVLKRPALWEPGYVAKR